MKKVLYIIANPKDSKDSYSKSLGDYTVDFLSKNNYEVTTVDVYNDDIQLLDKEALEALAKRSKGISKEEMTDQEKSKLDKILFRLRQFKASDEIIFSYPMWNFSLPPMLKAYLDNLIIAGETFSYTPNGPIGLLKDKNVTVIQASGGVYSSGPMSSLDHGSYYIEELMKFMGIDKTNHIRLEGMDVFGSVNEERLEKSTDQIMSIFSDKIR